MQTSLEIYFSGFRPIPETTKLNYNRFCTFPTPMSIYFQLFKHSKAVTMSSFVIINAEYYGQIQQTWHCSSSGLGIAIRSRAKHTKREALMLPNDTTKQMNVFGTEDLDMFQSPHFAKASKAAHGKTRHLGI